MYEEPKTLLRNTFRTCTRAFLYALLFSLMTNLLTLAMPLYTLQILDRVLSTGSLETLIMLSIIVAGTFVCLGALYAARTNIFLGIGSYLDQKISPTLLKASISISAQKDITSASQNLRDLGVIKNFFTKQGLGALFDIPWTPIYLAAIFFIHPYNAMIAVIGSIILVILAILNEVITATPLKKTNDAYILSMAGIENAANNADVIEAMGMKAAIVESWQAINSKVMRLYNSSSKRAILISTISQIARLLTQASMLGMGAYLVIQNQMTPGGIIATSILAGKVLAPFNIAITAWRNFVAARQSYQNINNVLENMRVRGQQLDLPEPQGIIKVEKVFFRPDNAPEPIVQGINFTTEAGDSIGIIGKSGAGKTTLCKLIAGIWKPSSGAVRLDDIDIFEWGRDYIKNYIGYLPQNVDLFSGTVKENIARMNKNADEQKVFEAAQITGTHKEILHLPNGYDTEVGKGGSMLSAGMKQRIGLARAFFDHPKVVILDEPNANLDMEGDKALVEAIAYAKKHNITLFIISHRPAILLQVDKIMVMNEGTIAHFDSRDTILDKFSGNLHF